MILAGVMLLVFSAAILFGGGFLSAERWESETSQVDEVSRVLRSEVDIALAAPDGYQRTFTLPATLGGAAYEILLEEQPDFTEIVVRFVNHSVQFEKTILVPSAVSGDISLDPSAGTATISIKKEGGAVTLS
ncbi:hypothetical protein J4439_01905 [Candidatus Woesearchaeota archaeon]|nr:hypothetical protein [Candidatus Woesearchaeota archaeon]